MVDRAFSVCTHIFTRFSLTDVRLTGHDTFLFVQSLENSLYTYGKHFPLYMSFEMYENDKTVVDLVFALLFAITIIIFIFFLLIVADMPNTTKSFIQF